MDNEIYFSNEALHPDLVPHVWLIEWMYRQIGYECDIHSGLNKSNILSVNLNYFFQSLSFESWMNLDDGNAVYTIDGSRDFLRLSLDGKLVWADTKFRERNIHDKKANKGMHYLEHKNRSDKNAEYYFRLETERNAENDYIPE